MGTLAYITLSQVSGSNNRYFENFAEQLYGSNSVLDSGGSTNLISDLNSAYNEINEYLRSAGGRFSVMPIQRDSDGNYPQAIQDWNAYLVIYTKMLARFGGEYEEIPSSVSAFGSLADRAKKRVLDGEAIFSNEIDVGELGIGQPQVVGALGSNTRGTFVNSWQGFPYGDSGVSSYQLSQYARGDFDRNVISGEGFAGRDFPRTWVVSITTAGAIGTAKYSWSYDSGITNEETGVLTDTLWYHLRDNVWVRFEADVLGSNVFSVVDKWRFQTVPIDIRRAFSKDEAKYGKIRRGFR